MKKLGLLGIDHPAIASNDVELLAKWYCDVLGYTEYFRNEKPVWILKAPDGSFLEIMPKDETARPFRTTWSPGWSHLALRVRDIEVAITYLDVYNVKWGGPVIAAIGGGYLRSFYDVEGNMLQLVERNIRSENVHSEFI